MTVDCATKTNTKNVNIVEKLNERLNYLHCFLEHLLSVICVSGHLPRMTSWRCGSAMGAWVPSTHRKKHFTGFDMFKPDYVCVCAWQTFKKMAGGS